MPTPARCAALWLGFLGLVAGAPAAGVSAGIEDCERIHEHGVTRLVCVDEQGERFSYVFLRQRALLSRNGLRMYFGPSPSGGSAAGHVSVLFWYRNDAVPMDVHEGYDATVRVADLTMDCKIVLVDREPWMLGNEIPPTVLVAMMWSGGRFEVSAGGKTGVVGLDEGRRAALLDAARWVGFGGW